MLPIVVGNRAGNGASNRADGGAAACITVSGVVADGCASCAAESRTAKRGAGAHGCCSDCDSEDCFQTSHFVLLVVGDQNACPIVAFLI